MSLIYQTRPFMMFWNVLLIRHIKGRHISFPKGHVEQGETESKTAEREVLEEMGIQVDLTGVRPVLTKHAPHIFDDYYFVERDMELSELRFQPEEVCDAKWADEAEVLRMLEAGVFIPYHKSFISLLFDLYRHGGNVHRYEE